MYFSFVIIVYLMLESLQSLSLQYWTEYKKLIPTLSHFSHQVSSQEVLERIQEVVGKVLSQIFSGEKPSVSLVSPKESYQYDPETGINRLSNIKYKSISFGNLKKTRHFARFLCLLESIHENVSQGVKSTKRELYYKNPQLFKNQKNSDSIIEEIAALLQVPRNRLNVLSAGKGLVAGNLSFCENDTEVTVGNRVTKIPFEVDSLWNFQTEAEFVLVLEKDTVLTRLVEEGYFQGKVIGVTGCGYPDLATREFVRRIVEERSWLPVFVVCDFDPHGVNILCTYAFGSASKSGECDSLALPFAHWLGVHFTDTVSSPLPLTTPDVKLLNKLVSLPQFSYPPTNYQNRRFAQWKQNFEKMLELHCKYEIESVLVSQRLSDFITDKVTKGAWI